MPDSITLTMDQLQQRERLAVQEAKVDILVDDFKDSKIESEKELTAIDANIKEIFELIRNFPDRVAQCKTEIEEKVEEKYMTKTEFRTMLRTAMWVGGALITAVQASILFMTLAAYFPKHEAGILKQVEDQAIIELYRGKVNGTNR